MSERIVNRLTTAWGNDADNRRTCMLLISHACNLRCSYCYESFKSERRMSFADARAFILKEASRTRRSKKYEELEIDLMGGEPMTHFPLIRRLVEWAEKEGLAVPWIFSMTTNGTLFTDEAKEWFVAHKESISVGLSYDGADEMQRINRGTGPKSVDVDFFLRTWPEQGLHLTVSRESLPHLASGVLRFQRVGVPVDAALAEGPSWTREDALVYREQLETLAAAYLEDESLPLLNVLCRPLDVSRPDKDRRRMRPFCGAGDGMIAYDVDGRTYPCHMFSPLVLGEAALPLRDMPARRASSSEDVACRCCVLRHFCPTCAGFNLKDRGDISRRDKRKCALHLVEAEVSAQFQIKLLARKRESLDAEEAEYADRALSALSILENLADRAGHPYC